MNDFLLLWVNICGSSFFSSFVSPLPPGWVNSCGFDKAAFLQTADINDVRSCVLYLCRTKGAGNNNDSGGSDDSDLEKLKQVHIELSEDGRENVSYLEF